MAEPPGDDHEFWVIIATWEDGSSREIQIQYFIQNGELFMPIFSDDAHFKAEIAGSGFEDQGVRIRKDFFRELLNGDELLILNPGSDSPQRLRKEDL